MSETERALLGLPDGPPHPTPNNTLPFFLEVAAGAAGVQTGGVADGSSAGPMFAAEIPDHEALEK